MKNTKYIFILFLLINYISFTQQTDEHQNIFFDAVFFKGNTDSTIRLDVFTIVPYQTLNFIKIKDKFSSEYQCNIKILDNNFKLIQTKEFNKLIIEDDYYKAKGSSASFDYSQNIFELNSGNYTVVVTIKDKTNNREYEKSRILTLIDYSKYDISLSSILLLSSIEERNGKFIITPHISDDISDFKDGFFAFFELYSSTSSISKVDFIYSITNSKNDLIFKSNVITKEIIKGKNQLYIKINPLNNLIDGKYVLRIQANKFLTSNSNDDNNTLAIAERSLKFQRTFAGSILKDIDNSIKQLRYIATQSEINQMEEAKTFDEKVRLFEDFWKKNDPTPETERNEAFDEYFARVEFANRNFKSYLEGWRTDKGNVYIVYGPPYNIEKSQNYSDGRIYEIWTYQSNKRFIFIDNNGFGDFRLYSPLAVTEKYKYQN